MLREFQLADISQFLNIAGQLRTNRFSGFHGAYGIDLIDAVLGFVGYRTEDYRNHRHEVDRDNIYLVIAERDRPETAMGYIALYGGAKTLAFFMDPKHQRKGHTINACVLLFDAVFQSEPEMVFNASAKEANAASRNLLEKIGYKILPEKESRPDLVEHTLSRRDFYASPEVQKRLTPNEPGKAPDKRRRQHTPGG